MPREPHVVILTCEHASRAVPPELEALFAGREGLCASHRGYDPGALELAQGLAAHLGAPLEVGAFTRLVVDLNRSERHPRVFSEVTRGLPPTERERLLARYHRPYRQAVRQRVAAASVLLVHVSVHTFTPVLDGQVRTTGIGLLYDPRRAPEKALAGAWQAALAATHPGLVVHRNRPYLGRSDGVATWLRGLFGVHRYLGFELEVSQALSAALDPARIGDALALALRGIPREECELL